MNLLDAKSGSITLYMREALRRDDGAGADEEAMGGDGTAHGAPRIATRLSYRAKVRTSVRQL